MTGYAAGNTDTFMREQLLAAGFDVYTSPAMVGGGQVVDQPGEGGPFGDCPPQLPADLTVDSTADPSMEGKKLADFLRYLHDTQGVDEVHLVGHSMGGIHSRVAIAELAASGDGPKVVSLSTVGTPWEPVMIADFAPGQDPAVACDGNRACLVFQEAALGSPAIVAGALPFLQKPRFVTWTQAQAGVLDGIPVTMVGGTYFTKDGGSPGIWPNDGGVQIDQALAKSVPEAILPIRTCVSLPDTHSIFVAAMEKQPDSTALTWDPRTTDAIIAQVKAAAAGTATENRAGCPTP